MKKTKYIPIMGALYIIGLTSENCSGEPDISSNNSGGGQNSGNNPSKGPASPPNNPVKGPASPPNNHPQNPGLQDDNSTKAPVSPSQPSKIESAEPAGLQKRGNTCYMNATVQAFVRPGIWTSEKIKKLALTIPQSIQTRDSFAKILEQLEAGIEPSVKLMDDFISKFMAIAASDNFRPGAQNDATEFFNKMNEVLYPDTKVNGVGMPNIDSSIKIGYKNIIECEENNHKSGEDVVHIVASIEIGMMEVASDQSLDVQEGINQFFAKESIDDYFCEKCGKTGKISKYNSLVAFPNKLVLLLKRYDFMNNNKIENELTNYEQVELRDNTGTIKRYNLQSAVLQRGSLNGGHYTAVAKNSAGEWWNYNDSSVSKGTIDSVKDAYILIYEKV